MRGVERCLVGYSGGIEPGPSYSNMKDHTESVFVEFDASVVDYRTVLQTWKSISMPHPAGRQYRTALFFLDEAQERVAKEESSDMEHVDVESATKFFMAEARHQDFLDRL